MDQEYMTKMATSFLDELSEIEKRGFGALKLIGKGLSRVGQALGKSGTKGGVVGSLGGKGAQAAGGVMPHMKNIWRAGADKAVGKGGSGFVGGLRGLGKSRYGQMAAGVAAPVAVGYGASRMMS